MSIIAKVGGKKLHYLDIFVFTQEVSLFIIECINNLICSLLCD